MFLLRLIFVLIDIKGIYGYKIYIRCFFVKRGI